MSAAKPSVHERPEAELRDQNAGPDAPRIISFTRLKYLSFMHSAVYLTLLAFWLSDGSESVRTVLGWAHGIGWIVMSLLCIEAVRRRVIPLWLAVMVAVVGGIGPFAGSIGFVVCERRLGMPDQAAGRGMV
jgi:hypothetical protein